MRQVKCRNPITWESWKSDLRKNRVPRAVGQVIKGYKNIQVMKMKELEVRRKSEF
jgi:hypothetical protein